ncbi:MAG: CPBP family intramembrane glutamic endopeptidase [Bacteroidota bacterium]
MIDVESRPAIRILFLLAFLLAAVLVFPPGSTGSGIFYVSVSFFMIALFLASYGKGFPYGLSYLRLIPKRKDLPGLVLWGAAGFILSIAITAIASLILSYFGFLDADLVGQKIQSLPTIALMLAFTLAPVGEEALFRGYLFRKISEKGRSYLIGALLSSAIFAAMHFLYGSIAEIAVAFLIALVLCALTQKTGSLVPAMVAHASFNFLSIAHMVLV